MDLIFFRLSVPCDEKSGRVKLEGFIAVWRTRQFCSPQDPFNSAPVMADTFRFGSPVTVSRTEATDTV